MSEKKDGDARHDGEFTRTRCISSLKRYDRNVNNFGSMPPEKVNDFFDKCALLEFRRSWATMSGLMWGMLKQLSRSGFYRKHVCGGSLT